MFLLAPKEHPQRDNLSLHNNKADTSRTEKKFKNLCIIATVVTDLKSFSDKNPFAYLWSSDK